MLFNSLISAATIALLSVAKPAAADDLPSIEIVGNKFFYSNNGSQFYIKGVAYQLDVSNSTKSSFTDPLADPASCKRDIPYLQELSTNVIRVYAVNASLDHTECMQLFNDAGIYVIADLAEPSIAIDTESPSWNLELYDRYTKVIDMFHDYTNVLGFFAGNEVITNSSTSDAAPYVKAAIRDMKQYMSDQDYRDIPIGYSANDASDSRVASADYFSCGDDDVKADFYGINMYEWCGSSSFTTSGYQARTEEFKNLTIPVFFSEYGCNVVQPRKFTEVQALYGDDMTDVWSGGIVYMYFQEVNDYGLVSIGNDNSVKTLADFNYLKSELASISPSSATTAQITANTNAFSCPATGSAWAAATKLPPTPDESFCNCVESSLSCVVSSDVDEDDYADLFSYVCGVVSCDDVNGNGTTGEYGDYSFCSPKVKLNYVLNKYYLKEDSSDSACSFDGSATINSDATTAASCSSVLTESGDATLVVGTATHSSKGSSATSGSGSSSDSASSSSKSKSTSGSSSKSKSAASSVYSRKYAFSISELSMTLLLSTTLLVGVCVFAL